MSRQKCPLCGHYIIQRNGQYTNGKLIKAEDGQYVMVHKKCPNIKPQMPKDEKIALSNLLNQVVIYKTTCPKGYVAQGKFNGKNVQSTVKRLYDMGYSFEDQLYALDEIVKEQGGFWGIGALENNIREVLYKRDLAEERQSQKEELIKELGDKPEEQIQDLEFFIKDNDFEW